MPNAAEPGWKALLDQATKDYPAVASTLATIDGDQARVRSVIPRTIMLAKPWLPLLITTTDSESFNCFCTPKVKQITDSSRKVELAWWFPEPMVQFRITANAYILPTPTHPLASSFPAARLSPSPDFDWEEERFNTYKNKMGASLRASFLRPIPGTPIDNYDVGKDWPAKIPAPGEETTDAEREQTRNALANFSLFVLEPFAVEYLELKIVPNQRTMWTLEGQDWKKTILVP
ncbi:hypothetical protein DACRYDRAFT_106733 [Dacryopinax primogenitus]|uniref:Pyridoxamine 5'-phosphate oxidase Alr4036 family FMN-binding domain-containing protein n=1 Tax=Dacryopinax primogenitus (strain DJM 731) TaxID=1858805 RepID=M5G1T7_DACPD|nr:uncharacterized protein DACRYDRAFT_106733 [Dacryopinax primogenitus]EJU02669.1 hypothetical protein DACRYDRAFT_106733 [Dacryopinax primogenitus]